MHNEYPAHTPVDRRVSIAIVGAGPTGLAAANLLGMAGIDTLLIERNAGPHNEPRAISIDDEGLRICQAMGLIDEVLADVLLDIDAHYLSGAHYLAQVTPTSNRNGYPLISTFHQPTFERTLLNGLARFACVETLFQHTLAAFEQRNQRVILSIHTPASQLLTIECAYLLACDGAKSSIRRALGIPMRLPRSLLHFTPNISPGKRSKKQNGDQTQRWLVIDCVDDDDPSTVAIFFCDPARPAVTVPAPHNGRRWEFMLLPGEREEDLLQTETIHTLIKRAGATAPQVITRKTPQLARQTIYTFHAALAERLSSGRVFLLGDTAHLMPPFGGQGMNSGLRDAHNLCWKLQAVLRGVASPGLLETYHQERSAHIEQMILFSSILGKLIMPTRRSLALLRDIFFRGIINHIPPFRTALTEMRVKPQPRYHKGFLLSANRRKHTGALLPQPYVMTQEGKRVLLDDALGNSFALIRLYEKPGAAFAMIEGDIWKRLEARFVCVCPTASLHSIARVRPPVSPHSEAHVETPFTASPASSHMVVADIEGKLSAFLRGKTDVFVLVRPDRYVMGVFGVEKAKKFAESLKSMLYS